MEMDEGEICREYKSSKYPNKQIEILAQLNCVSKSEIREILIRNGLVKPKKYSNSIFKPEHTNDFDEKIFERLDSIESEIKLHNQLIKALTDEYMAIAEFIKNGTIIRKCG